MHKLSQGPRDYKFRSRYEVIRKDEIPPYLRDFPDCMIKADWAPAAKESLAIWEIDILCNFFVTFFSR